MRKLVAVVVLVLASGVTARAQEPEEREERQPLREIRVLEDPKDISSFYRSHDTGYGLLAPEAGPADRYPIASFYRQGRSGRGTGYSRFWTTGYGTRRGYAGYRRTLGQNGDLYLIAPTFLAPVGPLSCPDEQP